jgi:hypothetical protein
MEVKSICGEILHMALDETIGESCMRRISSVPLELNIKDL